jgi:N-terminal domain of anti-restriction factor ArdC
MSKNRKLTEQEREQRRQQDRDRLERAARELLSSDGWARWVRVRASTSLGRYSLRNQWILSCEAARRGITPTHVAGFRAWLALNRVVTKGQKAIYILAPMSVKQRDVAGEETGEKRVFYRSVPVFDASQTEPLPGVEPVPLSPPREPITGDSHSRLLDPLGKLAGELGYSVREVPLDSGADGWCDSTNREIVVNALLSANARVRVLVHECAHSLGVHYTEYGRHQSEVLVDTVTYIVLSQVGLNVGGESIPYVAGWGESGALDAIRQYAETIDQLARRIEDALTPPAADVPLDQPAELERAA